MNQFKAVEKMIYFFVQDGEIFIIPEIKE